MKKTLAVLTLLAGAVSGYSQGQVIYADYLKSDFQVSIWSPQPGGAEQTGNSSAAFAGTHNTAVDNPQGSTSYSGTPLGGNSADHGTTSTDYGNGSIWSVQLYAAPGTVATFAGLSPIAGTVVNFYTDSTSLGFSGSFNAGSAVTIAGAANGTPATFALAAWYNGGGAFTSYAAAVAANEPAGTSTLGTENVNGSPNTPPDLPSLGGSHTLSGGITSFSLATVPEPSTIALGVIGASAFLMRLRRK